MAEQTSAGRPPLTFVGSDLLRRKWGWYVALGAVLILLGAFAIGWASAATVATVYLFGWAVLAAGALQAIHGVSRKKWSGFFIDLVVGILYFVTGFMIVANPGASALALTLFIGALLFVSGIFRAVVAVAMRYPQWGWGLLHGIVALILGVSIWQQWPYSGMWVIGLVVGIDMVVDGVFLVMLGFGARRLSVPEQAESTSHEGPRPPAATPPQVPAE